MKFREENLEDIIFNTAQTEEGRKVLKERGLNIEGVLFRQVDLYPYGRADLIELTIDTDLKYPIITIYELKIGDITVSALTQAFRYKRAIEKYFNGLTPPEINIVLIGEKVENSDWVFLLETLMEFNVSIYTYYYDIQGLLFKGVLDDWDINGGLNQDTIRMFSDAYTEQLDELDQLEAKAMEQKTNKDNNEKV